MSSSLKLLNVNMFLCVRQYARAAASESEPGEYGRKGGILSSISALFDIVSLTTQHNNNAEKFVDSDDDDDITQGVENSGVGVEGIENETEKSGLKAFKYFPDFQQI